jgi:hypothetical protein
MKENIMKMAELNAEIVTLIKEEKFDEVVLKAEEVATLQETISKEAEELEGKVEKSEAEGTVMEQRVAKLEEVLKEVSIEDVKKYASLNISGDDVGKIVSDLKEVGERITKCEALEGRLEKCESYSKGSQQNIEKNQE